MFTYSSSYENTVSFLLGENLKVESLGQIVSAYSTLWHCCTVSKVAVPFSFHPGPIWQPQAICILTNTWYC